MFSLSTAGAQCQPLFEENGVALWIKREDLIHPVISGNKWRKLKYHLAAFQAGRYEAILSFGGAHSNHLAALAALGKATGIATHALVRGELYDNPTLRFCRAQGMALEAISREKYRLREDPEFLSALRLLQPGLYLIPEGGKGPLAVAGCREILDDCPPGFSHLAVSCGTGSTAAGLLLSDYSAICEVYPALKLPKASLQRSIVEQALALAESQGQKCSLRALHEKLRLEMDYHFGGFGKVQPPLVAFAQEFYQRFGIALDPIYTVKLFYALFERIKKGVYPPGSRILAIHSGGLQGIEGMNQRLQGAKFPQP